jgi:hypothetical protein
MGNGRDPAPRFACTPALRPPTEILLADEFLYPGDYFGRLHNHFFG